ncbi:hypothetical protein DF107_18235 [Burkholderia stagnalis]|uniref:hypothetical protein n=1 Tax=Burkholderia stagnalis TaxID=1503054 RepID=UPI000F5B7974|nr:hypothetical protein [Burkholderia stagnalis]RQQ19740.1 hypothetical protein DF161_07160 [Burkholderia stagnalis]RQY67289.1 hypothetical protein DF109_08050 [Burkholderia stagnalis]RQY80054.1 hypothetical protein DF107_18235 [Burkholderia stagnalis]
MAGHYFILDERHEPVEVDLTTFSKWTGDTIGDTTVAPNVRVWTVFLGVTNDRDPPEVPRFVHYIYEPGSLYRTVDSYGYDYAVGRHERIAAWLKERAAARDARAAAAKR